VSMSDWCIREEEGMDGRMGGRIIGNKWKNGAFLWVTPQFRRMFSFFGLFLTVTCCYGFIVPPLPPSSAIGYGVGVNKPAGGYNLLEFSQPRFSSVGKRSSFALFANDFYAQLGKITYNTLSKL
jgi:hypothetical protein